MPDTRDTNGRYFPLPRVWPKMLRSAGRITETNSAIADEPGLVNADAEGSAWFFKIIPADPAAIDALMDTAAYAKFIESH